MLENARNVLKMAADAILELIPRINGQFTAAVELILACP